MKDPRRIYNRFNLEDDLRLTPDEDINDEAANQVLEKAYSNFIENLPRYNHEGFEVSKPKRLDNGGIIYGLKTEEDITTFEMNLGEEYICQRHSRNPLPVPRRIEFYQTSVGDWKAVDSVHQLFSSVMRDKGRRYLEDVLDENGLDKGQRGLLETIDEEAEKEKAEKEQ